MQRVRMIRSFKRFIQNHDRDATSGLLSGVARIGRLSTKGSVLLLCDIQEKFRPNIFQFTNIVSNAARLLQACRILSIPQILTEQYPKGLGPTVPELGAEGLKPHTKTSFSMLTESVESALKSLGDPQQVILCGIEAQACIACTTYDLLERGMEVHIVADAVSSRSQTDRLFALSRLKQSGAFLSTTEGVLLQLVQDAKHPNFKEIQKLLAHPSPDTGLLAFFSSL
uniref:Isochorismatase domain containing 2 n=1 Tax=Cyprinus carpio TaxID=7962 RepID=A0A8C2C4A1_CYPCA